MISAYYVIVSIFKADTSDARAKFQLKIMRDPFEASASVARLSKPLANYLGLSTLPLHAHEIVLSFAVYELLFKVVSPALSRRFWPQTYGAFNKRTRINWDSRVTSQIQQAVILSLVVYTIISDPQRAHTTWQMRLWGYNGMTGLVQALAAGYFLWDVHISSVHMDVMGADSLAHATGWLLITLIGFVSLPFSPLLRILRTLHSTFYFPYYCRRRLPGEALRFSVRACHATQYLLRVEKEQCFPCLVVRVLLECPDASKIRSTMQQQPHPEHSRSPCGE